MKSSPITTQPPDQPPDPGASAIDPSLIEEVVEEIAELPQELAGAATAVREDIEAAALARWAVGVYFWLMDHAPTSTRGRVIMGGVIFVVVLAPSLALLYLNLASGQNATQSWFGKFGYAGIFLANLASTATLFIPVPGLTAAAQALIASSAKSLSPFWVGVCGGLGMALGEITAYVAGMATAFIAQEEQIKPPQRLQRLVERVTRWVDWLMAHYGMPTLFTLSVVPNPLFEVAGWTAGATRYSFWKFIGSVTPGKVIRGILLAYLGEKLIFG